MDLKSWIVKPEYRAHGRGVCAAIGVVVAAILYYKGYAPVEPTALSGVAVAAAGAAAGVLVYGIFDIIRKVL